MNPETIAWISAIGWTFANLWTTLFAIHAYRPMRTEGVGFLFGFFSSWLTIELAPHFVMLHVLIGVAAGLLGAMTVPIGWLGLATGVVVIGLLLHHWTGGRDAAIVMKAALSDSVDDGGWPRVPLTKFLNPFRPARKSVKVTKNIKFASVRGRHLHLDVFQPKVPAQSPRPAIIQLHGGAWIVGDKREQGLPLLYHLADRGWVGFNVNYGLSPAATFPEHLVDIKRAIVWIREHAEEYGIDPNFIAVTGGSAGGHLTALAALTANDPEYQPGFETADTSIQAAVPFYAIYDFVDRNRLLGRTFRQKMLEPIIMKRFYDEDPDAFHRASPLDRTRKDAPPFFVVHGDRDTLAPIEYARTFVKKLSEESDNPVYFAEIRGAQHAFDVFISPRTARVIAGVERFLHANWQAHRIGLSEGSGDAPELTIDGAEQH